MTASLPQEISEKILMRSDEFLLLVSKVLDEPTWLFTLVDKDHPLSTGDAPRDLVRLSHDYHLSVTWGDVTERGNHSGLVGSHERGKRRRVSP